MFKICSICKKNKPISQFGKRSDSPDGKMYRCYECANQYSRQRLINNPDKIKEAKDKYYKNNQDKIKKYYKDNVERFKESNKRWSKNNRAICNAKSARRRTIKKKATPIWLTPIQLAQIQEFYDLALARSVQTGIKYDVDHIHPLSGFGYNGLHVPWNLQIIESSENREKYNYCPKTELGLFW